MKNIPLERKITDQILYNLKSGGGWWMKTHGGAMQVAGLPDIIGVCSGYFFALEVKRPKVGVATALQISVLRAIYRNGGVAAIVTSAEEAKAVLDNFAVMPRPLCEPTDFEAWLRTWYNAV